MNFYEVIYNRKTVQEMPFKNLFNEWHVRDCSRKVRNVVNAKAQRGIRVGTRDPYCYRKGETKALECGTMRLPILR